MPGFLSSVFDGSSEEGGYESQSSSYEAGADNDTHLDPSLTVESSMSGSYETPDGTSHSWERTDSVTLDTDTHVVTSVTAVLTDDSATSY